MRLNDRAEEPPRLFGLMLLVEKDEWHGDNQLACISVKPELPTAQRLHRKTRIRVDGTR